MTQDNRDYRMANLKNLALMNKEQRHHSCVYHKYHRNHHTVMCVSSGC